MYRSYPARPVELKWSVWEDCPRRSRGRGHRLEHAACARRRDDVSHACATWYAFGQMAGRVDSATHAAAIAKINEVARYRSEEHTSELQSLRHLVCRLLLE